MTGFGGAPYRIDLQKADFQKMPDARGGLSPDEKTGYIVRRDPDNKTPAHVVSVDLNTGQERQIWVSPAVGTPQGLATALSPDGRTLALGWTELIPGSAKLHIARIAVDGSNFREVFTRSDSLFGGGIVAWSKDGRSILFNQEQSEGASHWGVMRVPAEGGPATLVIATPSIQGFDLSPDGTHFAYSAREGADELWALDNVLSALK